MGFPRQEYWSGLPFSSPGDLPDPGIKPASPALAGRFLTTSAIRRYGPTHLPGIHSPSHTWPELGCGLCTLIPIYPVPNPHNRICCASGPCLSPPVSSSSIASSQPCNATHQLEDLAKQSPLPTPFPSNQQKQRCTLHTLSRAGLPMTQGLRRVTGYLRELS